MKQKVLVALGGNAILTSDSTAKGQQKALEETANYLVQLVELGCQLIISHGNGPQVGNLLLQQAAAHSDTNPALPLDTCVAMTQGSIGYWLQNRLQAALRAKGISRQVTSLVTQVQVDKNDPAFVNPTKPVGPFLSESQAKELEIRTGDTYIEDAGRGFRKVVPSPKPLSIVEEAVVKELIENEVIVITCGGGGIPVIQEGSEFVGVEAVIDKDFASAKLAEVTKVDKLIILTGVDNVYLNFNQPSQEKLEDISVKKVKQYISEGQFAKGSMLPKIEAAVNFLECYPKGEVVITSLTNLGNYLQGGSATVITY
ncbi:carbamate kinase [Streptococcus sp. A23]|uniref:carbamate kinase n=1 Tax=Streptococcus TaxID=1301 RepID=UPI000CF3CAE9|nr:carbamate kinase [Streptococcus suis]